MGKIRFEEGNPVEAQQSCFMDMKQSLHSGCKINFLHKDLIESIEEAHNVDFVSLSDVPSYFSGEVEKNYLNRIAKGIRPSGIIVQRNYLRIPDSDRSLFDDVTSSYQDLINEEKVQMYHIEILKKR